MTSQLQTTGRRHIVVNGDDFGASRRTNQAILQAFEKGLISSTTIMANMPAFEEACQFARERHLQQTVGLHLNLTEGRPLTAAIAACPRFCDASGYWLPRRRVLRLSRKEVRLLEAETEAQIIACQREGIIPTHLDSHHHMHAEVGIASVVIRAARQFCIGSIRLAFNCGLRVGASAAHRMLGRAYRHALNTRLRIYGLAHTDYFGDARDTVHILRATTADVEVMVHPRLDECGRLVDLDGEDLEARIAALRIPVAEMCSYCRL